MLERLAAGLRFGWSFIELAGGAALGVGLGACPRRWRFAVARRAAGIIQPLLRVQRLWVRDGPAFYGRRAAALSIACSGMHRLGVGFDPAMTVHGAEKIGPGGALVVTAHFHLTHLFVRWLHDRGHKVSMVMFRTPERPRIAGTRSPLDVIAADERVFVRVRRRVREGRVVFLVLDAARPLGGYVGVETPNGRRYVSDAAMRFAERARIPLLCCSTVIGPGGVVVKIYALPPRASTAFGEFCRFLINAAKEAR